MAKRAVMLSDYEIEAIDVQYAIAGVEFYEMQFISDEAFDTATSTARNMEFERYLSLGLQLRDGN